MSSESKFDVVVAGAGISGLSFARSWAESHPGKKVLIIERRSQLGGNCHDFVDDNGILVQKYGPHIFHTRDSRVWEFLSRFTEWTDYRHKVVAKYGGEYYPIPINRKTINKFFGVDLRTEGEVRDFLKAKTIHVDEVRTSRDAVVSRFGEQLYEAFIRNYTKKQWGVYPEELPASVLQRLPVRLDDNDEYYDTAHQGMPKEGFTRMFERMADLPNIEVAFGRDFQLTGGDFGDDTIVIYTGRIDELMGMRYGQLPYLYTDFVFESYDSESYQPNSVVNHPEETTPFIRSAEFKKLNGQHGPRTTVCFEYSSRSGTPTHPVPGEENMRLYGRYMGLVPKNCTPLGRLGRYSYMDMDIACAQALRLADELS